MLYIIPKLSFDSPAKKYYIVREYVNECLYFDWPMIFATEEGARQAIQTNAL